MRCAYPPYIDYIDNGVCCLFAVAGSLMKCREYVLHACFEKQGFGATGFCFLLPVPCLLRTLECYMVKPHGRLVLVSSTRCRASTPSLSTLSSSRTLQGAFRSREISFPGGLRA